MILTQCASHSAHEPMNLLAVTVIQEQLLLAIFFWVTQWQRLQKTVDAHVTTAIMACNQPQRMRHNT
jgi:hypothetical protein